MGGLRRYLGHEPGGDDHRLQAGHRRCGFLDAFWSGHRRSQGRSENQRDPAKGLKDASASTKAATKVLDGIIREASDTEKSVNRTVNNRAEKSAPTTGITYEILL